MMDAMNYHALRGLRGSGGRSSVIIINFSSIRRRRSDLRPFTLEDRLIVGRTSFLVIFPVLVTIPTFSLLFYQQQDRFSTFSTDSSNLCLGRRSFIFRKSFRLGGRIFSSRRRLVIVLLWSPDSANPSFTTTSFPTRRSSNSLSSKSLAERRSLGSTLRQRRMKASRSSEQGAGRRLQTPLMMVFLRDLRSWLTKGGFSAANSYRTQPSDHTSHLLLQGFSCQTQGLAQQGVPVWVLAIPLAVTMETFMSANFTCAWSFVRKILADLISLCSTLTACRASSPFRACWATRQMRVQSTALRLDLARVMSWKRSPPSRHSVTMQKQLESQSKKESRQARMQGLLRLARMRTSLRQLATSFSEREAIRIFLRAYSRPSSFLLTRYTVEKAPSPSLLTTVY